MEQEYIKVSVEDKTQEIIDKAKMVGRLELFSEIQDWFIEHQNDSDKDFRMEAYLLTVRLSKRLQQTD